MKTLLSKIAAGCAVVAIFSATSPMAAQAFFFIFPSPVPFIFVDFGDDGGQNSVQDRQFTFTAGYGSDYVEFSDISTNADAQYLANLLSSNPSISEVGNDVVIDNIRITGYTANERTVLISKLRSVSSTVSSTYLNNSGVLRHRVRGSIDLSAAGDELGVTLRTTRSLAFPGQTFSLQWANANLAGGSCQLSVTGPATPTLPSGSVLQTNGSVELQLSVVGEYLFTYRCNTSGDSVTDMVTVRVVPTDIPEPVLQASAANCYIPIGMNQCEAQLYWDTYIQGGSFSSVTLTNVTTQTLLSTDERGLSRPIVVRHGDNTISLNGNYVTSTGSSNTISETIVVSATCVDGAVWNGSICVSSTTGGGWDIISDIEFYGGGYAGMPALNGGSFNHPANTSCQRIDFWACSTQPNAAPVAYEIFADNQLIHSGFANRPRYDTVDPRLSGVAGATATSWGPRYGNMPSCMSGVSDHKLTHVSIPTPPTLKDGVTRNMRIKVTREDGVSRWVIFNSWNGREDQGYPNSAFQNFPIRCAPDTIQIVDLASSLQFPQEVLRGVSQPITNAQISNMGALDLTESATAVMVFDYIGDGSTEYTRGQGRDFEIRTSVANIASGQTVFPNFNPAVFTQSGAWRVRLGVDPGWLIETTAINTAENNWPRQNNWTNWFNFTVVENTNPTAEINPRGCTVAVGETMCQTTVTWSSTNLVGGTQVLQNGNEFSVNPNNTTGVPRNVTRTNRNFIIRSGDGTFSANRSADVRCDGDWDESQNPPVCLDANTVEIVTGLTLRPERSVVRTGQVGRITLEIDSTAAGTCAIYGAAVTEISFPAGESEQVVETNPLSAAQRVRVVCNEGTPNEVEETVVIEVVPVWTEI